MNIFYSTKIVLTRIRLGLLFFALASPIAQADDNTASHAQGDPHEHGVATLHLVADGARVSARLDSPALNLLGFESGKIDEQRKTTIKTAYTVLIDNSSLIEFPGAKSCRSEETRVSFGKFDRVLESLGIETMDHDDHDGEKKHDSKSDHDDHDHDHDHHDEEKEHGSESDHDDHDHHDEEKEHGSDHDSKHADIEVEWIWKCDANTKIDSVKVQLFRLFPGLERLRVEWVLAHTSGLEDIKRDGVINLK